MLPYDHDGIRVVIAVFREAISLKAAKKTTRTRQTPKRERRTTESGENLT
jgi:hypothetical protein